MATDNETTSQKEIYQLKLQLKQLREKDLPLATAAYKAAEEAHEELSRLDRARRCAMRSTSPSKRGQIALPHVSLTQLVNASDQSLKAQMELQAMQKEIKELEDKLRELEQQEQKSMTILIYSPRKRPFARRPLETQPPSQNPSRDFRK